MTALRQASFQGRNGRRRSNKSISTNSHVITNTTNIRPFVSYENSKGKDEKIFIGAIFTCCCGVSGGDAAVGKVSMNDWYCCR